MEPWNHRTKNLKSLKNMVCCQLMPGGKNGCSVGSYSIRLSFLMKQIVIAIKKGNLTFFCQQTQILPLAKRGIAWQRTLKPIRGIYKKSLLRVFVLKTYGIKWPILKMKQLIKNPGGTFLQIQRDIHVNTDPLLEIIIKICSMYSSSS